MNGKLDVDKGAVGELILRSSTTNQVYGLAINGYEMLNTEPFSRFQVIQVSVEEYDNYKSHPRLLFQHPNAKEIAFLGEGKVELFNHSFVSDPSDPKAVGEPIVVLWSD